MKPSAKKDTAAKFPGDPASGDRKRGTIAQVLRDKIKHRGEPPAEQGAAFARQNLLMFSGAALIVIMAAFFWASRSVLSPVLIGGLLLFMLGGLKSFPMAGRISVIIAVILLIYLLVELQVVVFPFIVAFFLAYLLDPVADLLERIRIRRSLAIYFILFLTLALLFALGSVLIPNLVKEIEELINRIPDLATKVMDMIRSVYPKITKYLHIDVKKFEESLLDTFPARAEQALSNIMKGITGLGAFLGHVVYIVLIPVLTFYFLKDLDRMKTIVLDFIPCRYRNLTVFYSWRLHRIVGAYIRGQFIVSIITGTLTGLGMAIFKIPFAIIIGVITGIFNLVPILGFYISLALALLTGLFTADILPSTLKIAGVFFTIQALEAYLISPRIVGKRVGLHPVLVIFSIFVFSKFMGFWGLLMGVPIAGFIRFLLEEWKRHRQWKEKRESACPSSN